MNENCTENTAMVDSPPGAWSIEMFTLAAHGFVLRSEWNPIYNTAIQEHEKPGNLLLWESTFRGDALRDMPEPLHG